ncbi:sodium- and chloride-dependent GABA transporter 1-like [Limulus polyphemus]|uniref:Transporter n=1 Tax=Limulus polyphemus TaxID=6850 RepID=A0ABM1C2K9_LIMPO|nr:sodium- and chloride-dependent GABA transporter 1-like [Limulus polyphemus]
MNTDMFKETELTREPVSTTVIVPLKKVVLRQNTEDKSIPERGHWSGKLDFIMGCISYAVGLGNVWRFPYLCYENGGGAFLFPYVVCLIICAIPLFFMEVALGQYLNCGGIGVWNLVPMFKGVGFASMTIVCLCNIYYAVIISWTLFYLVSSFTSDLPWKGCNQPWTSENCLDLEFENITGKNISFNDSSSPIQEFWE